MRLLVSPLASIASLLFFSAALLSAQTSAQTSAQNPTSTSTPAPTLTVDQKLQLESWYSDSVALQLQIERQFGIQIRKSEQEFKALKANLCPAGEIKRQADGWHCIVSTMPLTPATVKK